VIKILFVEKKKEIVSYYANHMDFFSANKQIDFALLEPGDDLQLMTKNPET
jgi:hypothetical protein